MNRKKTRWLYREEGLSVRQRRGQKKAIGTRAPLLTLAQPHRQLLLRVSADDLQPARIGRKVTRS